jgi:antitoxin (DNA-binding transcriptional repressor) of toxin-antitoxin stability system
LIQRACRGEEIVIARGKKPLVRQVALRDEDGDRKPGALKGRLFCPPDVFAPPTDREWKDPGFE